MSNVYIYAQNDTSHEWMRWVCHVFGNSAQRQRSFGFERPINIHSISLLNYSSLETVVATLPGFSAFLNLLSPGIIQKCSIIFRSPVLFYMPNCLTLWCNFAFMLWVKCEHHQYSNLMGIHSIPSGLSGRRSKKTFPNRKVFARLCLAASKSNEQKARMGEPSIETISCSSKIPHVQ